MVFFVYLCTIKIYKYEKEDTTTRVYEIGFTKHP